MLLDTENINFAKFLIHFQPFKGLKFQNFPGEHTFRTLRTSWHVSHIFQEHLVNAMQHFLSELKLTGVRFLTKIRM